MITQFQRPANTSEPENMLEELQSLFPTAGIVLTLGKDGSIATMPSNRDDDGEVNGGVVRQEIYPTEVVDTTAAGDTFTGFFLQSIIAGQDLDLALKIATAASSIAVSRRGAAPSIPLRAEVQQKLAELGVISE